MADRLTTPARITLFGALVALVFSMLTGIIAPTASAAQSCACDDRPLANRLALGEAAIVGTVEAVTAVPGGSKAQIRLATSYNTSLASSRTDVEISIPARCPVPAVTGQSFAAFVAASGSGIVADSSCSTLSAQTLSAASAAATSPSSDAAVLLGWTSGGAPVGIDERGDVIAAGAEIGVRDVVICPGGAVGVVLDRSGGLRQLRLADLAMGEALKPSGVSPKALIGCHDSAGLTITASTVDARVVVINAGSVAYRSTGSVSSGGAAGDLIAHRTTQSSSSPVLVTDVRTATTSILSTNVVDGRIDLGPDGRSVLSARSVGGGAVEVTLHTDLDAAAQVHRNVTAILVSDAAGLDLETDVVWLSTNRWAVRKVRDGRHQWSIHDRSGAQVGLLATDVAVGQSTAVSERLALVGAGGNRIIVVEPTLATKRLSVSLPLDGVQALPAATAMTPAGATVSRSQAATLSTNTSSAVNTTVRSFVSSPTSSVAQTPSTTPTTSTTSAVNPTSQSTDTIPVSVRPSVTVPVSTFTSSGAVRSTVVTPDDLGSGDATGSTGGSGTAGSDSAGATSDDGSDENATTPATSGLVGIPVSRPTVTTPEVVGQAVPDDIDAQPAAIDGSAATVAIEAPPVGNVQDAQAGGEAGVDDGLGSLGLLVLLGGFVAIIAAVVGIARWAQTEDADSSDDMAEGYFLYEPESDAAPGPAVIDLRDPPAPSTAGPTEPASVLGKPAGRAAADEDWSGKAAGVDAPAPSTTSTGVSTIARQAFSEQD